MCIFLHRWIALGGQKLLYRRNGNGSLMNNSEVAAATRKVKCTRFTLTVVTWCDNPPGRARRYNGICTKSTTAFSSLFQVVLLIGSLPPRMSFAYVLSTALSITTRVTQRTTAISLPFTANHVNFDRWPGMLHNVERYSDGPPLFSFFPLLG